MGVMRVRIVGVTIGYGELRKKLNILLTVRNIERFDEWGIIRASAKKSADYLFRVFNMEYIGIRSFPYLVGKTCDLVYSDKKIRNRTVKEVKSLRSTRDNKVLWYPSESKSYNVVVQPREETHV